MNDSGCGAAMGFIILGSILVIAAGFLFRIGWDWAGAM